MLSSNNLVESTRNLMQQLLTELDGDYGKALFVACGIAINTKNGLEARIELIEKAVCQKKRSRGRPTKGLMPVKFRKMQKGKKLGAPQTYAGVNKQHYLEIANLKNTMDISWREATRVHGKVDGLELPPNRIKSLSEQAKRYAQGATNSE